MPSCWAAEGDATRASAASSPSAVIGLRIGLSRAVVSDAARPYRKLGSAARPAGLSPQTLDLLWRVYRNSPNNPDDTGIRVPDTCTIWVHPSKTFSSVGK